MELVGVVLVVVPAPIVAETVRQVPEFWGMPTMEGFSLKMAAFSESLRGTLSRSSKRRSSCTSLKKLCSSK